MTFSALLLSSTFVFGQNAPVDFESAGKGANWTWTSFENVGNAALEFVANPSTTGINNSATVAKYTALIGGQPWAGCESKHGADIGTFTLSASNAKVKIMVYKSVISDVAIKFATSSNGSTGEIKVANTKTNEWEELTFDFSGKITETNDQIIIFPDFQARTTNNVCYFDNITFSAGGSTLAEPTVAAPTPTKLAANVISMFSNAYTNVTVDTWRTGWSAASLTDMQVAGNDVKKYASLDFVGIEAVGPNTINASTMDRFNIDIWTPNVTTFKIKLVDFGANGTYQGGDDVEHELSFTPTKESWNTLSIKMSDFTGLTTTAHIAQIIFAGVPTGTGVIYIDNVYFSKAAASISSFNNASVKMYPNPSAGSFAIESVKNIENVTIMNSIGEVVLNTEVNSNSFNFNNSNLAKGVYVVQVTIDGVISTAKLIVE
jgi:hypothetical protein